MIMRAQKRPAHNPLSFLILARFLASHTTTAHLLSHHFSFLSNFCTQTHRTRDMSGIRRNVRKTKVYLNVYDLIEYNGYAYPMGIGAYHSGVEVHGQGKL